MDIGILKNYLKMKFKKINKQNNNNNDNNNDQINNMKIKILKVGN